MPHRSARELALAALREWRTQESFADSILGRLLESSDLVGADRAFTTELFYGTLRHLSLVDFWIGSLRNGHLDHDARDLLRLGLYQLFLLKTPEHAAVYETVQLASARVRPLVNAILRNAVRGREDLLEKASRQSLSIRTSHLQFLIDRWTQNFDAEKAERLCLWNNQPAPTYSRINRLKSSVEDFLSQHADIERLPQHENFVRLTSIPIESLSKGHCYIQDPSTAAACLLLAPRPGETVLDACAAPGGKTGYLAELMKNQGAIVACDRDQGRLGTLRDNLERLGVGIARLVRQDWTRDKFSPEIEAIAPFDRILIDAPCSNTGVMRRRVDLRWRLIPTEFSRLREEQLRILRATIPLLKTGGVLVYSTCSIEPEENEDVVHTLLQEFPFLQLTGQVSSFPFREGFDGAFAANLVRVA